MKKCILVIIIFPFLFFLNGEEKFNLKVSGSIVFFELNKTDTSFESKDSKKTETLNSAQTLQDDETPGAEEQKNGGTASENKAETDGSGLSSSGNENGEAAGGKENKEKTDFEEKKEIIEYGLLEDILNLIKTLKEDKDLRFGGLLSLMFESSKSPEIRSAIFEFFSYIKDPSLKAAAEKVISENHEYKDTEVRAAILYLRENDLKESAACLREIIKDENSPFVETAVAALGKLGNADDALFLAEYYKTVSFDEEKKALIVRQNIMKAMEELDCSECWDFLLETAEDENENSIIRASAAAAIGKTGNEDALKVLTKLYEDSDPVLRAAAIKGISSFRNEEADALILQACKDPYYKVRLQAVQSAHESKNAKAVPFILYRAKTDPENTVRFAAIEALSELGNEESDMWLLETFNDEKKGISLRVKIAESLLKSKFDFIYSDFKKVIFETLKGEKHKILRYELGKAAAKIENPQTAEIAREFMRHKDVFTKSIGLDMFKKNRYAELFSLVKEISGDAANGALKRRAEILLEENAAVPVLPEGESEKEPEQE